MHRALLGQRLAAKPAVSYALNTVSSLAVGFFTLQLPSRDAALASVLPFFDASRRLSFKGTSNESRTVRCRSQFFLDSEDPLKCEGWIRALSVSVSVSASASVERARWLERQQVG